MGTYRVLRITQDTGEPGLELKFFCLILVCLQRCSFPFCGLGGLIYALFPRACA